MQAVSRLDRLFLYSISIGEEDDHIACVLDIMSKNGEHITDNDAAILHPVKIRERLQALYSEHIGATRPVLKGLGIVTGSGKLQ